MRNERKMGPKRPAQAKRRPNAGGPNKPAPQRGAFKPKGPAAPGREPRGGEPLRISWSGFRPLFDFWGQEIRRFYQVETLASAVEYAIRRRDRFIIPSVQSVLGDAPLTHLAFELFQEGTYQLIFRVRAMNARKRSGLFAMVAAKREGDYSDLARGEHDNLRILNERAPEHVVRPYLGGNIFLPDRHGRVEHGRDVYVYLTQWLTGFHEMGVTKNLQFYINTQTPHTFTIAQTELIKRNIVEVIARTYNEERQNCMTLPEIASGDFVVTPPPKQGAPKIKLIACRSLMRRATPAKILQRLAETSWDWAGQRFRLMPFEPETTFDGLARARGREQAREWFQLYAKAIESGRMKENQTLPLEDLRRLGG